MQALALPGALAVGVAFLLATDKSDDDGGGGGGGGGGGSRGGGRASSSASSSGLLRDRRWRVNPPLVDESVAAALSQGGKAIDAEAAEGGGAALDLERMERVRVPLGRVGFTLEDRPFYFARTLGEGSSITAVSVDRPLGIVFVEEKGTGRPVVEFVAPEGNAGAKSRALAMTTGDPRAGVREGDVLRGFSCPRLIFDSTAQALVGDLGGAKRMLVLFDTDGQKFNKSMDALASGLRRDGPVRLVLERRTNAA